MLETLLDSSENILNWFALFWMAPSTTGNKMQVYMMLSRVLDGIIPNQSHLKLSRPYYLSTMKIYPHDSDHINWKYRQFTPGVQWKYIHMTPGDSRIQWVPGKYVFGIFFLNFLHLYHKVSNIRRTKSKNWNDSYFVLKSYLPNPLKPGVMSRMKM